MHWQTARLMSEFVLTLGAEIGPNCGAEHAGGTERQTLPYKTAEKICNAMKN